VSRKLATITFILTAVQTIRWILWSILNQLKGSLTAPIGDEEALAVSLVVWQEPVSKSWAISKIGLQMMLHLKYVG
jgi:hypothetical protein